MSKSDSLLSDKGSVVREMYLHTADENYITARWCHDNHLMADFFWNSLHALEKYMKAILLFNGCSVKDFGHELVPLFDRVTSIAGSLLPPILTKPPGLDIYHWQNLSPREFVERLDQNGNAENRYLTYGYVQHAWYLHMVDSLVWAMRRLALPLDKPIVSRKNLANAPTHRQILTNQPEYVPNQMLSLEKLVRSADTDARRALLNNNCAFAPEDYVHEPRRSGTSARISVLLRRVIAPLQSSDRDQARRGYQMGLWLLDNTRQSKSVRSELVAAMEAALAAHPGIAQP